MARMLRLAILSTLMSFGSQAQPPNAAASVQATSVPDDAELERRAACIGHIEIEVDDVFEQRLGLGAPYRVANSLHISTHLQTVSQQLLFRSGDPYHRRVLSESARLLRGQRYLNEASVEPIRYNDDNTVDVRVRVHDVWTMSPGFSFGRKGGENSTRAKFEDSNFLGLGKQVSVARSSDVDRQAWQFGYTDPNVFGSWWHLAAAHASLSDGAEDSITIGRPFYALDARWSATFSALDSDKSMSLYSLGTPIDAFEVRHRQFDLGGGWSEGLQDGWVTRYRTGFRYDQRRFASLPATTGNVLPADRTLAYPWVGVEVIEDEYVNTRNLEQIGRTEDLYIGRSARVDVGIATRALGSTRDAFVLDSEFRAGADFGNDRYLIAAAGLTGRYEGGGMRNTMLELSTRYLQRQSEHRVLFAAVRTSVARNFDGETQLLLGGDNGLRGYPLRFQAGEISSLLTLEERFYTRWQPLKLVNVGAAIFVDAGRTWGQDPFAASSQGWLSDIGAGLRLGSARSGLGNVLHIDVALPLNRPVGVSGLQFLVETHKSF